MSKFASNKQEEFWSSIEGDEYLKRNFSRSDDEEARRSPFFDLFDQIGNKDISILEVGCNCGINLSRLSANGYTNLTGIDIGAAAVKEAQKRLPKAKIIEGSILNLPFDDGEFDLVFSSGVLIHQNPSDALFKAMDEMYRCSSSYILGLEDYSNNVEPIRYRAKDGFCWRAPYREFWLDPGAYTWSDKGDYGTIPVLGVQWRRQYYMFKK